MPDLSNLLVPPPSPTHFSQSTPIHRPALQPCSSSASALPHGGLEAESGGLCCKWDHRLRFPISSRAVTCSAKSGVSGVVVLKRKRRTCKELAGGQAMADHVRVWEQRKVEAGVPQKECSLPFLTNAPRMVECRLCSRCIYHDEEVACSVQGCKETYHMACARQNAGYSSSRPFRCSQHACFICKQKGSWRCIRCPITTHKKCAPWPNDIHPTDQPGRVVCWRHPADWRMEKEHTVCTSDIEEAFRRLPLPYINEEFKIDSILKDVLANEKEPAPYIHIRRNVYLVKKKRDGADVGVGCTNCNNNSTCDSECECRGQSISCSKVCLCSDMCTNRPFKKEKKIKVVKTRLCGWGVEALEAIKKGEFVIEYIGEVISDAICEQRLWDMKYRGDQKFYMCEIRKNFIIDATFKGNSSRFLNHSCDPNCKLEKWYKALTSAADVPSIVHYCVQIWFVSSPPDGTRFCDNDFSSLLRHVDGETRVGVFASRSIEAGEPLTYDYRFVHFGPMVECYCGASNCQGYLGSKKKINKLNPCWGCKRKRSGILIVSKTA